MRHSIIASILREACCATSLITCCLAIHGCSDSGTQRNGGACPQWDGTWVGHEIDPYGADRGTVTFVGQNGQLQGSISDYGSDTESYTVTVSCNNGVTPNQISGTITASNQPVAVGQPFDGIYELDPVARTGKASILQPGSTTFPTTFSAGTGQRLFVFGLVGLAGAGGTGGISSIGTTGGSRSANSTQTSGGATNVGGSSNSGGSSGPTVAGDAGLTGRISCWSFDEGQGEYAHDAWSGNDGVLLNGAQWSTGVVGGALRLDGANAAVVIPGTFLLHLDTDASLLFWMKRDDDTHRSLFWTRNDDQDANRYNIASGDPNVSNSGIGLDYRESNGNLHQLVNNVQIPTNEWVHIAVTRAVGTYSVYQNGVLVQQANDTNPVLPTYRGSWQIGHRTNYCFKGLLDEIELYSRALTSEEVRNRYLANLDGLGC